MLPKRGQQRCLPRYQNNNSSKYQNKLQEAIPYYQQIQAKFDPTGKVVSLGTIVNTMGRGTGPAMAALLLGDHSFTMVIWIALSVFVLSLLIILPLLLKD